MRRKAKPKKPYTILSSISDNNKSFSPEQYSPVNESTSTNLDIQIVEPTFKEAFQDYRTFYIWVMIVFSSSYPYFIASNFKTYEQRDIHDDRFITLVGSLGAIVNGLSRSFWATLLDFFGFKIVFMSLLVMEISVAFTFVLIHEIRELYLIWVLISFSTLGGHFSIFPTLCARIYGPSMGGKVFTFIFTGFALATLVNWLLSKQTSAGNIKYDILFYILGSMGIVALILAFFFNEKTKVMNLDSSTIKKRKHNK